MQGFVSSSFSDDSDEGARYHAIHAPGVDINDQDDVDHRWSEIVPPHSALTFAVTLEPSSSPHDYDDEDRISFSRAQILEDPQSLGDLPECFYGYDTDDIHDFPETLPPSRQSSECRYRELSDFKDNYDYLFSPSTLSGGQRSIRGMTQTSSTLGGLDVYLKGEAETLSRTHRRQHVYGSLLHFEGFDLELDRLGKLGSQEKKDHQLQIPIGHKRVSTLLNGQHCEGALGFPSAWAPIERPIVGELEWMKREPRPEAMSSKGELGYVGRRLKKRRRKPAETTCRDVIPPQRPEVPRAHIVTPAKVVPQYPVPALPQNPKRSLRNALSFKRLKRRYNDAEPPVEDWVLVDGV